MGSEDSTMVGVHMQHGQPGGHLPGSSANVELIAELEPTDEFGPIVPGQIADLAVYKDFAYLNSWNEETCTKGGVYVIDIRDPRNPTEVDFIPAVPGNFHGEGADVLTVNTKTFKGDLHRHGRRRGLRPLRRHGSAQPQGPGAGRRRPRRRRADERRAGVQHLPQRVHVERRRQGLPRGHR
jgi:hypothetical protein